MGLMVALMGTGLLGLLISQSQLPERIRSMLLVGLGLRVIGAFAYLSLTEWYYGVGDYLAYFNEGLWYAENAGGEISLWSFETWSQGRWWGTGFVDRVTGVIITLLGPTLPGAFIVFAVVSYAGILAFGRAFTRAFPQADAWRYIAWIALFPSLWFWPAALGKDAIVLCGVGLATLGFVGKRGRTGWLTMGLGVLLVFCIRPQVAATLAFALVAGHWLGAARRPTFVSVLQGLVLLGLGVATVAMAGGALGFTLFNPDEVEGYLDSRAGAMNYGGSALGVESVSPWMAPINVLFRPFLWEARGMTALLSAVEVVALWGLAWYRRREIRAFVRMHRRSRVFWMAVLFVLAYSVALGMSLTNMGIIARQRVHILPFLFMLFAGVPRRQNVRRPLGGYRTASPQVTAV